MSIIFFTVAVLVTTVVAVLIFVKSPVSYFKTKEGRKVAAGIVLAVLLSLGLSLVSFSVNAKEPYKYFDTAKLFVGLDYTRKISPMCDVGVNNDKLTSNLGVRASIVSVPGSSLNFKYTHHSCAVNPDNRSYDAAGIEVVYTLW